MGKIVISNNSKWLGELNERLTNAGFTVNGSYGDMLVYDKLKVHVINCCQITENDYIASNGTLVYKDLIGEDALRCIFNDYLETGGNISEIRKNCFGNFFVLIKTSKHSIGFVDESGIYAMYYYARNNNYLISNTFFHIESVVNESINKNACEEELLEYCIYDNETSFNNIYRVMPEDVLFITHDDNQLSIKKCEIENHVLKTDSLEDVALELKDVIIKHTSKIKLFSNNPIIFMTGGVDSRLSLATYLAAGLKPIVCTWGGNKFKMNTKDEDAVISERIAQLLGLEFVSVDVSEEDNILPEMSRTSFERYGEWAKIYGGNKKWFDIFEKGDNFTYEFGYFGETIKGWELLDSIKDGKLCINDFCKIYTGRQRYLFDKKGTFNKNEYEKFVHNKIRRMAVNYGMDLDNLSKEDCMILYYRYRLHADTKCANMANMFGFCTPVLANKEVADLINQCPYRYKEKDKMNLLITKLIDERLIDIQYFTHTRYMTLDKEKLILCETKENIRKQSLIEVTKQLGIYGMLKKMKSYVDKKGKTESKIASVYADEVNKYPYFKDMGIIVNESTFNYIQLALSMLCHSKLIEYAMM